MGSGSIDRRVIRTRAALHEALLSLIAAKGYDAVTVEEICARANVGRSTFYAHYSNKHALMRFGLKALRTALLDGRPPLASARADTARLAFSLPMFEHARAHAHLHGALLGTRGGRIALDGIRDTLGDVVRRELASVAGKGTWKGTREPMPRELVVRYLVGAYMAVAAWWLDQGARLAPAEVDAMFQRLAFDGIGAALRPISRARPK
jgi:AcrR family transcriptional regulator